MTISLGHPEALRRAALALVLTPALLAGCGGMQRAGGPATGPMATAALEPTAGNTARGTVRFHQHGDHVMLHATVSGLKPGQEHGFHVHEKGDCGDSGNAAGGHFNPGGKPHGAPGGADRHAGDLPALKADASGNAELRVRVDGLTADAGPNGVVGRGLIVHAQPDDYRTQPTGNSGARIACAVIAAAAAR